MTHQATQTAVTTISDLDNSFGELDQLLGDNIKQVDDLGNTLKDLMVEHWDQIEDGSPLIGLALYALPIFLFGASLVGGAARSTFPSPSAFPSSTVPIELLLEQHSHAAAPPRHKITRVRSALLWPPRGKPLPPECPREAAAALWLWRPRTVADATASGDPGGGLMAGCARKHGSGKTARCCNGLGVFATGGAWVGTSLCGVVLIVIGLVLLMFSAIVYDSGSLMVSLSDPGTAFAGAERCLLYQNEPFSDANIPAGSKGLTQGFDNNNDGVLDGSLPFCTIIRGCMAAWSKKGALARSSSCGHLPLA